jgi:hypothetical protein
MAHAQRTERPRAGLASRLLSLWRTLIQEKRLATIPGTRARPRKTIPVTRPGAADRDTAVVDRRDVHAAGIVSGTIQEICAGRGQPTVNLDESGIERLVSDALRSHEKAVRDFRRVEGIAQPVMGGLGFQALHLVFRKWIEMAALSLERAASALDDALFGLLRHLYRQTASGRDSRTAAGEMRRTLEALDRLRQEISQQQQRLRQLVY